MNGIRDELAAEGIRSCGGEVKQSDQSGKTQSDNHVGPCKQEDSGKTDNDAVPDDKEVCPTNHITCIDNYDVKVLN